MFSAFAMLIPDYSHNDSSRNKSVCPPFTIAPALYTNLKCNFLWSHEETANAKQIRNLTIQDNSKETHGMWSFAPQCSVKGKLCSESVLEKVNVSCPPQG